LKVLHILKKKPEENVEKIIALQSEENEVETVKLYEGEVDYSKLLELIFSSDKVVSW
jgi:hypothetical protein